MTSALRVKAKIAKYGGACDIVQETSERREESDGKLSIDQIFVLSDSKIWDVCARGEGTIDIPQSIIKA